MAAGAGTVNLVASGPIRTDNFWGIIPNDSGRKAALAERLPVCRLDEPEDVSRAFMFFADPAASFITGQALYVCGGAGIGTVALQGQRSKACSLQSLVTFSLARSYPCLAARR